MINFGSQGSDRIEVGVFISIDLYYTMYYFSFLIFHCSLCQILDPQDTDPMEHVAFICQD